MIKEIVFDVEVKKTLSSNKYTKSTGFIYYNFIKNEMLLGFKDPVKSFIKTNQFGEIKIYDPKNNEVMITQNVMYSTKGHLMYYFFSQSQKDLGLSKMGFVQNNRKFDGQYEISEWIPPVSISKQLNKVLLVTKYQLPTLIEYYKNETIIKKTYFSDYQKFGQISFPLKVVEIDYIIGKKDSSITYTIYSNPRINSNIEPEIKNFEIPSNAKVTTAK